MGAAVNHREAQLSGSQLLFQRLFNYSLILTLIQRGTWNKQGEGNWRQTQINDEKSDEIMKRHDESHVSQFSSVTTKSKSLEPIGRTIHNRSILKSIQSLDTL